MSTIQIQCGGWEDCNNRSGMVTAEAKLVSVGMLPIRCPRSTPLLATVVVVLACAAGCQTTTTSATISRWHPPIATSAVGQRVRLAPIIGPPDLAAAIRREMLQSPPSDVGRRVTIVDPSGPPASPSGVAENSGGVAENPIALVSATEPIARGVVDGILPNGKITLRGIAETRMPAADFVLRGEVLPPPTMPVDRGGKARPLQPIRMTWRLLKIGADGQTVSESVGGTAMKIEPESSPINDAISQAVASVPQPIDDSRRERLIRRAAERSFDLITPSVRDETVVLMTARRWQSGDAIARGNQSAIAGDWWTASKIYQSVLEDRPRSIAAIHNLAVARVAGQDFLSARRLIATAMNLRPSDPVRSTMRWIEQAYQDHQQAFGLPADQSIDRQPVQTQQSESS